MASAVLGDELKKQLHERIKAHRIDINERVETFLGEYGSVNTQKLYSRALSHFFDYLAGKSINPLFVKAYEADRYLRFLDGAEYSAGTKRLYIAGISTFYSHLERWDDIEKNPFRGAKRPKRERREKPVPTPEALEQIQRELKLELEKTGRGAHNSKVRANLLLPAIHVLSTYGLRVGALPTLRVEKDGTYTGESKGKPIQGVFPSETLNLLKNHGRSGIRPFQDVSESRVRVAMLQLTRRLHEAGVIEAEYSPHSLRHFFAVEDYRTHKDIYRLRVLLDHAGVQVTENYLRSLGIEP